MPPEIPTDFTVLCCKSQGISSGIMELGKIRFAFGSGIAGGRCRKAVPRLQQVLHSVGIGPFGLVAPERGAGAVECARDSTGA